METKGKTIVSLQANIHLPIEFVWKYWTSPEDIVNWNNASDDWHTTRAENDLRVGGRFVSRMEAKDGSVGFDFGGVYNKIELNRQIEYTIDDGRKVKIVFTGNGNETLVVETFETESVYPVEMQRDGWQAILNNFKKYSEEKQ